MEHRLTDQELAAAERCAADAATPAEAREWITRLAAEVRRLGAAAHPEPPLKRHGDGLLHDRASRQGPGPA